jgi:hypothetical protein
MATRSATGVSESVGAVSASAFIYHLNDPTRLCVVPTESRRQALRPESRTAVLVDETRTIAIGA